MKRFVILLTAVVALMVTALACGGAGGTPVAPPSSYELYAAADQAAAEETTQAWETRQSLEVIAKGTSDAIALSVQGTRSAMDLQGTQIALTLEATRQAAALALELATGTAVVVRATAEARATGTAKALALVDATATAAKQAHYDHMTVVADRAQMTAIAATAQHVERRNGAERVLKPLKATGWALFTLAMGALAVWAGVKAISAAVDRLRVVRRRETELEPFVIRGDAIFLPLRSFGPRCETAPTAQLQDRTTARAQLPAVLAAAGRGGSRQDARPAVQSNGDGRWQPVESETPVLPWPNQVNLLDVLADRTPALNDLVVGVRPRTDGRLQVVSASLHELMHTLAVGASGWGKSTWLRSFPWQVARAREPVEVIAIDVNGSEFNALCDWHKLRYPVARTTGEAVALLAEISGEIERRRALYERFPLASKLTEYNRIADDPLAPWIVVIDEGTSLLNRDGTGDSLRDAVQCARQYGVYVLLAGQSAQHKVIPTQVRDNFSTRLCFRTSPTSSKVVLDSRDAGKLTIRGRALVQLRGRELTEVQGPFISRAHFLAAMGGHGPRLGMPPVAPAGKGHDSDRVAHVLELHAEGASDTRIAREVFGHGNTYYIEKVRAILRQQQGDGDED